MENQAPYSRHHVSECPFPEIPPSAVFAMSYVVAAPDQLSLPQIKASALALVADAGLLAMPLSVQQDLGADDEMLYRLYAHEPVFETIVVYAYASTWEELLASFSRRLGEWARRDGLLPALETMEEAVPC